MKRILFVFAFSLIIGSAYYFCVNRNQPRLPDIFLQLNGDQMLCNGVEVRDWLQVWRKRLDALSMSDRIAKVSSKDSTVSIQTTQLRLKLDPDLSYGVFQELLTESATRGYVNYVVSFGSSEETVSFSLLSSLNRRIDGKYTALDLSINSDGKNGLDADSLKLIVRQRKFMYLKLTSDPGVSLEEVFRPIRLLILESGQIPVAFSALREHGLQVRGRKTATFEWKPRDFELRNNIEYIEVPQEILKSAEVNESVIVK